jgi:polysaccharide export outer membrane protein
MMPNQTLTLRLFMMLALISGALPLAAGAADQPNTSPDSTLADTSEVATATFDYKINPGDIIAISVWREDDLQREVLIRPDGKFSFPLAGDINAKGKSVEQVRELLTKKLSRFIPDLVVSVSILAINGNKVYVIGQVNRPGDISVNPNIDIMQALSIAGGANPFAQLNDISILRRTENGLISIPFRYGDIEKGKRLEQNIVLKAGDVVVVP